MSSKVANLKWYEFDQNNSGGSFVTDNSVAHFVLIEAISASDANRRAEEIGIYFDGCLTGNDCNCCGDRWSKVWSGDETDMPTIYGSPAEDYVDMWTKTGDVYARAFYVNGFVKEYRKT